MQDSNVHANRRAVESGPVTERDAPVVDTSLMLREFFLAGSCGHVSFAWTGLVIFIAHGLFNAWLKWALNDWYSRFYDGLQDIVDGNDVVGGESQHLALKRAEVFDNLVEFAWTVAPAVVVHPVAKWIASVWRFHWRMSLVRSYLVHYDVMIVPIEGTAQRIRKQPTGYSPATPITPY